MSKDKTECRWEAEERLPTLCDYVWDLVIKNRLSVFDVFQVITNQMENGRMLNCNYDFTWAKIFEDDLAQLEIMAILDDTGAIRKIIEALKLWDKSGRPKQTEPESKKQARIETNPIHWIGAKNQLWYLYAKLKADGLIAKVPGAAILSRLFVYQNEKGELEEIDQRKYNKIADCINGADTIDLIVKAVKELPPD